MFFKHLFDQTSNWTRNFRRRSAKARHLVGRGYLPRARLIENKRSYNDLGGGL
jgi:hypothetical protein